MSNEKEVLVIASKVKAYIKKISGFNTSAAVIEVLSDRVRDICDKAVENAKADKRKTIKDRDIQ